MEQQPEENTREDLGPLSAPADQVRGGEMDVTTPSVKGEQQHAEFPDEVGDVPEQPTLVTPHPSAESPHAATESSGDNAEGGNADLEHDAMTQADLPQPNAAYGQPRPRPRVEREML